MVMTGGWIIIVIPTMKSHEKSSLVFTHQMAPLSLPHELGEDNPGGQRDEKRHCRSAAGAMFSGEVLNIWGMGFYRLDGSH